MTNYEENPEQEQEVTKKEQVMQARGKEVPVDLFLYSCFEYEKTAANTEEFVQEVTSWPELEGEPDFEDRKLAALLNDMLRWYRDTYETLATSSVMDHEHMSAVLGPLVMLNQDLKKLYEVKIGEPLPAFDKSVGNNKFWDDIDAHLQNYFERHFRLYQRYIQWSHAAEPDESFEPGSRPPVGRYAPRYSDRPGNSGGDRSGGSRGPRGNDRGPRRGGNDRGGRNDSRGGRDRGGRDGGRGGRDRGGRGGRGGRDRGGPPRRDSEQSAKLEAAAMDDVANAVKSLETDHEVEEISLKPTNSFYRRLQHKRAMELGFSSFSVGEGQDRAVKIARPLDDE